MKALLFIVCSVLLAAGCTSYKKMKPGSMSGGYEEVEVGPGLVLLGAQTGAKPWADYPTAWQFFYRRADELYGAGGYEVILSKAFTYNPYQAPFPGQPDPVISIAHGFVLAKTSPLTKEEALRKAHEYIGINAMLVGMEEPNQALQPTPTSVTPPAAQESRQP